MDVVIDVINTIAMVSHALGAVAELQVRVVCIRTAAHFAFPRIWSLPLLFVYPPGFPFVVYGLGPLLRRRTSFSE